MFFIYRIVDSAKDERYAPNINPCFAGLTIKSALLMVCYFTIRPHLFMIWFYVTVVNEVFFPYLYPYI